MKHSITIWLCAASALACSAASRPPGAPVAAAPAPERVESAQVSESAPLESGIPTPPEVAPPAAAPSPAPDQTPLTLTPASGAGSSRTTAAPSVENSRDSAETPADRESVREIRARLTSQVGTDASQVIVVARNGRIWLRGQVNTAAQSAAVEKAARSAGNVLNVNNELTVME